MKYLLLIVLGTLSSPLLGGDTLAFKCDSKVFNAGDANLALGSGMIDISKITVLPSKLNYVSNFRFTKNGAVDCQYSVGGDAGIMKTEKFIYPMTGDKSSSLELQQKFTSFIAPLKLMGEIQYQEFFSNQTLADILKGYIKAPSTSTDKYLQFRKDDVVNTTIVVTDLNEEKILYRIVVPNTSDDPLHADQMIANYKATLKAKGDTDAQIAQLLPNFQKIISRLQGETQLLKKRAQWGQFDSYTDEP